MPQFDRDPAARGPVVQGFAAIQGCPGGGFSVDGGIYRALLLTPVRADAWENPPALDALTPDDIAPLLGLDPPPEFLLLGTGARTRFAPRAFTLALEARGIGVEAMDSRAAARTWGMLRSEERWIAAALMPLG